MSPHASQPIKNFMVRGHLIILGGHAHIPRPVSPSANNEAGELGLRHTDACQMTRRRRYTASPAQRGFHFFFLFSPSFHHSCISVLSKHSLAEDVEIPHNTSLSSASCKSSGVSFPQTTQRRLWKLSIDLACGVGASLDGTCLDPMGLKTPNSKAA